MGNPVVRFEGGAADTQPLVAFYGELFGWDLQPIAETYTLVDTRGGQGLIGGVGRSDTGDPWATFYVEVEDLQTTLERAEALGGRTVVPVVELPGMAFAMFDDPDGLLVGLMRAGATADAVNRPPSDGTGRRSTGSRCWGPTPGGRRRSTASCSAGRSPGGPTGR